MESVPIRIISGPYFPVFGLNTEIYLGNYRPEINYVFGHFSHGVYALIKFISIFNVIFLFSKTEYLDCAY